MLRCTVKFCGGCNPRYDRGAAYQAVRSSLSDVAQFSYPEDGTHYDALLIIRGCTGCPYLYEEDVYKRQGFGGYFLVIFLFVCVEVVDGICYNKSAGQIA